MIILGIGSNKGDRAAHLRQAVQALSSIVRDMRQSRIFESRAVLPADAPESWNVPYLNMAISGHCTLLPHEILQYVKELERSLGRKPSPVWSPREIDIDILAIDDLVLETSDLTIPHPHLLKRDFALIPLAEVAAGWKYPREGAYHYIPVEGIIASERFTLGEHLRQYE